MVDPDVLLHIASMILPKYMMLTLGSLVLGIPDHMSMQNDPIEQWLPAASAIVSIGK